MGFREFASGFKKELVGKPKAKKKPRKMSSTQKGKYYAKKTKSALSSAKKSFSAFAERQAEIGRQEREMEAKRKKKMSRMESDRDMFGFNNDFYR